MLCKTVINTLRASLLLQLFENKEKKSGLLLAYIQTQTLIFLNTKEKNHAEALEKKGEPQHCPRFSFSVTEKK